MNRKELDPRREKALLRLLDDPNPEVRQALLREYAECGASGLAALQRIARDDNRVLAYHAAWYLRNLDYADPVQEFRDFIRSFHYELETGSLLLNRTVSPDLDVGECCGTLDEISNRCRDLMFPPMSPRERCRVINRVLFHEYEFRGNVENYTDPRNSLISEVLASRRGLPITLCVIYILVGQRCGLALEPVGIPGHFLVGCFETKPPFFIDAFARGVFRVPEDVFAMLRKHNVPPKLSYLTPTPVREVICRCCRNLVNHYTLAGQSEGARLFASFVHDFEAVQQRHLSS